MVDRVFLWARFLFRCGHCVLGNTSLEENAGEDLCGVCEGENECLDCAGVPHGNSVVDFCDNCVLKNSENYNKGKLTIVLLCYDQKFSVHWNVFGLNVWFICKHPLKWYYLRLLYNFFKVSKYRTIHANKYKNTSHKIDQYNTFLWYFYL